MCKSKTKCHCKKDHPKKHAVHQKKVHVKKIRKIKKKTSY